MAALNDAMIEEVSGVFAALGDPSRMKILRVLLTANTTMPVGAVADRAGLSQANTSKHLITLMRAGLVVREASGVEAHFRPVMPFVSNICGRVSDHLSDRIRINREALG